MAEEGNGVTADGEIRYVPYRDESDMPAIVGLIEKDLSEPYSVFTYRYFINNWPDLCFLTMQGDICVGVIVCKLDEHRCRNTMRGYIAMLAVDKVLRGRGIGKHLVHLCLDRMRELDADECVLETELSNKGALGLYRSIGFVKEKRLHKYYLNGNDAFRLKYLFKLPEGFSQGLGCLGAPFEVWPAPAPHQGSRAEKKQPNLKDEKEQPAVGEKQLPEKKTGTAGYPA
ncbi:unnamed protein product [Polarella glacialis]|uniref:N-acetyltransferase domain-containing protein n=1 Tax=Polarella glacialis TaxID=89957 RepID=A0A813HS36_POLGL|nr:unnamed protein product [Polarella glacialis]CAE8640974.1 unnamed protein product [Polarella glacialis]CAE8682550.1 unnamed protein product [Polarella glacialis]